MTYQFAMNIIDSSIILSQMYQNLLFGNIIHSAKNLSIRTWQGHALHRTYNVFILYGNCVKSNGHYLLYSLSFDILGRCWIVISCGVQGKKDQQVATIVQDKLKAVHPSECCYRLLDENRHRCFWNYCITCSITMYWNLGLGNILDDF